MPWLMPQLDVPPFSMDCICKQEGDFLGVWKHNGKMFSKSNISKHNASSDMGNLLRLVHLSACPASSEICVSSSNCEWAEYSVSWLCHQLQSTGCTSSLRFCLWLSPAAQAVVWRELVWGCSAAVTAQYLNCVSVVVDVHASGCQNSWNASVFLTFFSSLASITASSPSGVQFWGKKFALLSGSPCTHHGSCWERSN